MKQEMMKAKHTEYPKRNKINNAVCIAFVKYKRNTMLSSFIRKPSLLSALTSHIPLSLYGSTCQEEEKIKESVYGCCEEKRG